MARTKGITHRNQLTEKETKILSLLSDGLSNQEVSEKVGITRRTVESHRARIMLKLNLHTLPELVKYSIKNGLTTSEI